MHFLHGCEVAQRSLMGVRRHLVETYGHTWDDPAEPLSHLHLALLGNQNRLHPAHIVNWVQASYITRNALTHGGLDSITMESQVKRIVDTFKNMRTPMKARKPPPWH